MDRPQDPLALEAGLFGHPLRGNVVLVGAELQPLSAELFDYPA